MSVIFREVLSAQSLDDGVRFDLTSLQVGPIREAQEYRGVRLIVAATLAAAKVRIQVDIGFGDAVTPAPIEVDFPTLLDLPRPRLRAYPRETVVAEKLEAIVQLGMSNSRMKDFFDLVVLSRSFEFDGDLLVRAIRATFDRRKTPLPSRLPVGLSESFATDPMKAAQWAAFHSRTGSTQQATLAETTKTVSRFVSSPLSAAASGDLWNARWPMNGPWSN